MTYCVGLRLDRGLVYMADTRTNSGVDNVSVFRKLHQWEQPGERVITLMAAGNLATTQAVISILDERTKVPADRHPSILEVPTMFRVAALVGGVLRDTIATHVDTGDRADSTFDATMIVGGQIADMPPRLFLVYPEGNFIEAGDDTPFFQIGETKYGRPILVAGLRPVDVVRRRREAADGVVRLHAEGQPLGGHAARPHRVRGRLADGRPPAPHRPRRPVLRRRVERMGGGAPYAFQSLPDFSFDRDPPTGTAGRGLVMRRLVAALVVSSALLAGACSDDDAGPDDGATRSDGGPSASARTAVERRLLALEYDADGNAALGSCVVADEVREAVFAGVDTGPEDAVTASAFEFSPIHSAMLSCDVDAGVDHGIFVMPAPRDVDLYVEAFAADFEDEPPTRSVERVGEADGGDVYRVCVSFADPTFDYCEIDWVDDDLMIGAYLLTPATVDDLETLADDLTAQVGAIVDELVDSGATEGG